MPIVPEIVEVDNTQLEEVLCRVEQALDEKDAALIRAVCASYIYVTDLVEDKKTSIRRLRQRLFGARTEKTDTVVGRGGDKPEESPQRGVAVKTELVADETGSGVSAEEATETAAQGHGRNGADAYRGAERIVVPHPSLRAGDPCPACDQGTVYEKAPGMVVRISGQPPLTATIYQLQKLRCHLCGQVFTAAAPQEAANGKYEATAGSMIGLLKYGSGLPFNRLEGLQGYLEIPLPASTQWDIVNAVAANLAPVFEALIRQAAQGEVLHNDDTTVKILELMRPRGQSEAVTDTEHEGNDGDERTGLFTSGVVALRDGHRVALFFSGRQHAGENLAEVLKLCAEQLPPPIQMCDALSRNLPGELQTIVANCLAHARRQFVEVYDRFPEQCRHLLETLAVVDFPTISGQPVKGVYSPWEVQQWRKHDAPTPRSSRRRLSSSSPSRATPLPRPHAPSASARTSSATGSKPSKPTGNTPSPVVASSPPSRRRTIASALRTNVSWRSATS